MSKYILVLCLLLSISGCISVGEFPENRERLHEMGEGANDYCHKYPRRCYQGIPW